jgi:hypothetical protein
MKRSTFAMLDGAVKAMDFRRGDFDGSSRVDITDMIATLACLFLSGDCSRCQDAVDANDDGHIDISDAIFTLFWLFGNGAPPPPPGPFNCGSDPTPDSLDCLDEFRC